jgi:hypothetical protein
VVFHHDSSVAPQTSQNASPVCGTKNFSSVRLYSAPQLHRTIVAILGICPCGTPDQPQFLCPGLEVVTAKETAPARARVEVVWGFVMGVCRTIGRRHGQQRPRPKTISCNSGWLKSGDCSAS